MITALFWLAVELLRSAKLHRDQREKLLITMIYQAQSISISGMGFLISHRPCCQEHSGLCPHGLKGGQAALHGSLNYLWLEHSPPYILRCIFIFQFRKWVEESMQNGWPVSFGLLLLAKKTNILCFLKESQLVKKCYC